MLDRVIRKLVIFFIKLNSPFKGMAYLLAYPQAAFADN
ncbi:hypothetical protein [African swine fever virus]|nr:unnamed protein [African swine fever virus]WMQ66040.1 hypothetical protein [African swine fever virus]WMZ41273.1 hypothetical protein [African swine fever virus]